MSDKRVCVIGAGPSGLAAVKTCLEDGLKPVCYEKTPDLGGLWRFRPENVEGTSSVMKTTVINTSKEINAFSDFPPPEDFPNYMHNEKLLDYLERYAKKFDLSRHIQFNCSVLQVSKTKDHNSTGRWDVQIKNQEGTIVSETFEAIMVCTGHHVYPNIPKFQGLDIFKGRILHTHDMKSGQGFEDTRSLVIGIGNSGADAAVELSRVCKQVYLSTRKGAWLSAKADANGFPSDLAILSRFNSTVFLDYVPWNVTNALLEKLANKRLDHSMYGLKPKHRILSQHPTLNDDLPNRILAGTVQIKDDVDYFTEHGVKFKDDKTVYDLDALILATGYQIKLPFLTSDIISTENNEVSLYKYVFPPSDGPPTLAVIGLIQPRGSILPISELHCRWATAVFKGECKLPSPIAMLKDIEKARQLLREHYVTSQRHTIQVDYVKYMDEIAALVGVKPNFLKLLLTDMQLFLACIFGPCYAYQYRLHGRHPWPGATEAILTAKNRIIAPLKTRQPSDTSKPSFWIDFLVPSWTMIFILLAIIFLIVRF